MCITTNDLSASLLASMREPLQGLGMSQGISVMDIWQLSSLLRAQSNVTDGCT